MYKELKQLIWELFHKKEALIKLSELSSTLYYLKRCEDSLLRHIKYMRKSLIDNTGTPTELAVNLDADTLSRLLSELSTPVDKYLDLLATMDQQFDSLSFRVWRGNEDMLRDIRDLNSKRVSTLRAVTNTYKFLAKVTKAREESLKTTIDKLIQEEYRGE